MLNMENYHADKLFYIVNLNVNSVVQVHLLFFF